MSDEKKMGEEAKEFLEKNITVNEHGKHVLPRAATMNFFKEQGVTPEHYKAVANAQTQLINGMYLYAFDKLTEKVDETKAAGGNPMACNIEVSANSIDGTFDVRSTAARMFPVPRTNDVVTKTMVTTLTVRKSSCLDRQTAAACEEAMRAQLGIN